MSLSFVRDVYARATSERRAASSTTPSTLRTAATITARPARPTAESVTTRIGYSSLYVRPVDPHMQGIDFHVTSCLCLCHYGDSDCSPLGGTSQSYVSCDVVRRD